MQVSFKVSLSMELLHKLTMQKLVINEDIERVYDEDSEEYTELCNDYCNLIGFSREEDKETFDKELMLLLAKKQLRKLIHFNMSHQLLIQSFKKRFFNGHFMQLARILQILLLMHLL